MINENEKIAHWQQKFWFSFKTAETNNLLTSYSPIKAENIFKKSIHWKFQVLRLKQLVKYV